MAGQDLGGFEKLLRAGEGRRVKRLAGQAAFITSLEPDFQKLSDDELRGKTAEFRQRLENGETLEDLLFEAFAAVREARLRESDQRMFDVQLMGGIVLHEGDIAEMKTGEGKTFVASAPLYLNALAGSGVHLVTVNDYLAKRDAEWNRGVFERLGMTVGAIENMLPFSERKAAYDCDITYGTNSEFGFDYLRDNMAVSLEQCVQRSHAYAIVDEVDSILVDEARTPLIISGEPETAAQVYVDFARIARTMNGYPQPKAKPGGGPVEADIPEGTDFLYDEKFKTVAPLEAAIEKFERALRIDNLYDPRNVQLVNHLNQALKAQALYQRDDDYVVQDGEVKIVDEFTGRIMEGRRWSEGLHQAVEAKEGVRIQEEHVTLATITLQNYFRLYEKLAGMTGTAKTEEKEFVEIYGMHVVEIPTNQPVARDDQNDFIYKTVDGKFTAVIEDIKERHEQGQPILVGTIAVETSEHLSERLTRAGIPHNVLNAKEHAREAEIIKDAGQVGAVTIATNMAGRGVDIKLAEGVVDLGGLYVLGTERHEARRIDNQLRGRSGRQGDPGESRFYLSAQDDLVRLFAGDRIYRIIERFKIPDDQPMEAKLLSKQIENAQKKVEEQNFVSRKNVLKYDDVMNKQRVVIYEQRRRVLEGEDFSEEIKGWIEEVIGRSVETFVDPESGDPDLDALAQAMQQLYNSEITAEELREDGVIDPGSLVAEFIEDAQEEYAAKEEELGSGADARARAVRDPPGGRPALARAPREHGLPPRGRAPPGDGPEGPARRVHDRGARDVRGAERARSARRCSRSCSTRSSRPRTPRSSDRAGGLGCRKRRALVRARVGGGRGRDRRRSRRRGRQRQHAVPAAAAEGRRAREARPERSVLVRLRQEVQEVPRRLRAPSRPLADDAIRLEPLDDRYVPDFERLLEDPEVDPQHAGTLVPAARLRVHVGRPLRRGLAGRLPGRVRDPLARGRVFLGFGGVVDLDLRRTPGGDRIRRRPGGARPRASPGRALRLITDWALGELGLERVELHIDPENTASIRVAERCGYVREGVLRSLHFKEDIRADMVDLFAAARPTRAAARAPSRGGGGFVAPSTTPHPGWGLAPFPCRRGYPARRSRLCAGTVSISPARDYGWPARLALRHGRGRGPAARPAARGDRDPARLGP